MRKTVESLWGKLVRVSLLAGFVLGGQSLLHAQEATPSALPPGKGKDLVAVACTQCHGLRPILQMRDGAQGWRNFVHEMVLRGAQLSPEEAETAIQYLAENLGPGKPLNATGDPSSKAAGPMTGGGQKMISLPPGAGKELIESRCAACHDVARVVTVKRSRDEWDRITNDMVQRGAQASAEEVRAIVSYLSSQFSK